MRLIISIILISLLSLATAYLFPWWSVAVVCFFVVLIFRFRAGKAFLAGFTGVFFLWFVVALIKDNANEHILSSRMGELIFKSPNGFLFIVVAAIVVGLVGGLAAWSGAVVRKNLL